MTRIDVEAKILEIMQAAYDGELTDSHRVVLYEIALTAAANEFHRLASNGTPPATEVLALIQQVGLVCSPETDSETLTVMVEDAISEED